MCGNAKDCSPGKHPIGNLAPRGVLDATDDLGVINRWWTQVPDANIGFATGKVSDVVVLDADGPIGEETLAKIERKHGSLPPTVQVKTGKGRHLYFRYPGNVTKVKSVARKKLGLDVRADGGYARERACRVPALGGHVCNWKIKS
jgi:putative DNA primase/helicase